MDERRPAVFAEEQRCTCPKCALMPNWLSEQSDVWTAVERSWGDRSGEPSHATRSDVCFDDCGAIAFEPSPAAVSVTGDIAIVHYCLMLHGADDACADDETAVLTVSEVLVRRNGHWQIEPSQDLDIRLSPL